LRAEAGALLAADIRQRGTLLSTGFLGTPLALDALADVGETGLAWDLLLRTDFPSWGYMVKRGATTIWERWNGDTGDVAMNSFNHYALGAVCGFLYRRVAGIDPIEPGFAKFRVAPVLDSRIAQFGARVDSVRGRIETQWSYRNGRAQLELTVPPNSSAEILFAQDRRTVGPGKHRLSF
jgi:alpha-L-rhamnosidase